MNFGPRDWAAREPERPALIFADGATHSYAELDKAANRFAHLFRSRGLSVGDHAAVIMPNDWRIICAVWGAWRAGIYLTPVATTFSGPEIAYVVDNCDARLVIADVRFNDAAAVLPTAFGAEKRYFWTGAPMAGYRSLDGALAALPDTPLADEHPGSLMLYSSGTTGAPKGICRPLMTPEQAATTPPPFAKDLIELFGIGSQTRYLSTAPLYHAAALRFVLATTAAGGVAVVMAKFDAEQALDLLTRYELNTSQWVPTMFRRLMALPDHVRQAFSAPHHTCAIHGAAPISPKLKQEMIDWWGPILLEYYSGTEGVGLSMLDSHEWLKKPGSVGRVIKGVPHILGDDWEELGPGETGRIYFSGIAPFEYYKEPEKTASRTSPQGYQTFGDIGHIDEDGFLFLSDRQDDMIISGGVNLYPQEIENTIDEMPEVAECAVVGWPDEDFGERPVGFVVRKPESRGSDEEFIERLKAFCNRRLGRTKQVREFHIRQELPKLPTGKLLRRDLKKPAAGA
ncbi:MAG: AMP-binding protein [Flavobacteriaceae bacterium]